MTPCIGDLWSGNIPRNSWSSSSLREIHVIIIKLEKYVTGVAPHVIETPDISQVIVVYADENGSFIKEWYTPTYFMKHFKFVQRLEG